MATKDESRSIANKGKKRKQRYLPQNRPVKKGAYPLRPGVQGFFITCDGGRERQASREALNVIDSFYEELIHGNDSGVKLTGLTVKPSNKKITFSYSSDEDEDDDGDGDDDDEEEEEEKEGEGNVLNACKNNDANLEKLTNEQLGDHNLDNVSNRKQKEENADDKEEDLVQPKKDNEEGCESHKNQTNEAHEPAVKKQCIETDASKNIVTEKVEEKSIDKLIDAELKELGDKNKRRFLSLDSGCNGLVFVQMRKRDGDPSPKDIVQHMMTSVASTRKHMSRFILRLLPVEVSCYASEDEISTVIKPLVEHYFPVETENPQKFAVLYEARANTGIDRMKIINTVAKSVPAPHKVDLGNPDKTIVVEIVKTVCLIGVVEKYKELAKYNLRQLLSSKQ